MKTDILIALLVGVMSGWTVTIFAKPWEELNNKIIGTINPKHECSVILAEIILDMMGFIVLIIMVLLASLLP